MGLILMTEDGKKPGMEGAGHPDPLSATGMFLNAFQAQPDQPVEQEQESAGQWFAAEDKSGAALDGAKLDGAKLGGPWGQPLNAPSIPSFARSGTRSAAFVAKPSFFAPRHRRLRLSVLRQSIAGAAVWVFSRSACSWQCCWLLALSGSTWAREFPHWVDGHRREDSCSPICSPS